MLELQKAKPRKSKKDTGTVTFIKDPIQVSLENKLASIGDNVLVPTQEEIQHVSVLFKSRKLDNIDVITYDFISNIARHEFTALNKRLTDFTEKMTLVKAPGLFSLIDELTKDVDKVGLTDIWNKAVNAKPSMMARFLALFNPSAKEYNLQSQYKKIQGQLTSNSKGLEAKLADIENKLVQQKHEQENNIKMLQISYDMYYESFIEIRKQFVFILYLEEFFKQEVEKFKANRNVNELNTLKQISHYDNILSDIENKKLVLQGALIRFPITVTQNQNLIGVSKNILKEIDNTLLNNFLNIRSNLSSLGIALNQQQALLGLNKAKQLDYQSSQLFLQVTADLTKRAEIYSSQARLDEANNLRDMVQRVIQLKDEIAIAKEESKNNVEQAARVLNETSQELKNLIGKY